MQPDTAILLGQLGHLHADINDIADLDRTAEIQGLDVDSAWARQSHADDA